MTRQAEARHRETRFAAVSALLLALLLVPAAHADVRNDVIGRLFLTPAERERIEQSRGQEAAADIAFDSVDPTDKVKPVDESVALNGLIRRADGTDVVWVNGKMLGKGLGASTSIAVRGRPDAQHRVVVEANGVPRPVRLKPGQVWERSTGRIVECFRCGADSQPAVENTDDDAEQSDAQ